MTGGTYYLEIFLIGLIGSTHCIGMCGGFVAMYSLKKPAAQPSLTYHVLYNGGRITTYSLLGGILGHVGSFSSCLGNYREIPGAVLMLAGVFMFLMGMNMAGILGKREIFGTADVTSHDFFRIIFRRVITMESFWGTFLLGLLLGFLPCGLLYPIFIRAAVSGNFASGTVTMVLFGAGTVPAMLFFGLLVTKLRPHVKLILYRIAAVLIILLGIQTLLRGAAFSGWIPTGRFW